MNPPLIVLGGGGHARVLMEALARVEARVLGFTDPHPPAGAPRPCPWLGDDTILQGHPPGSVLLVNGIGGTGDNRPRKRVFEHWRARGYGFATVLHPAAVIANQGVALGQGVQILAGAVVGPGARLGDGVLVNTRAVVEHDCLLADHVHVASGAVVCGGCRIDESAHIGAGAILIQGVSVETGALVAAGAVVTENVESLTLVAGIPAKLKKRLIP
jgi:sugar O-acyltransferase (sialic acid O-acetyltransferase NeuD family)